MREVTITFKSDAEKEIESIKSFYNLPNAEAAILLGLSMLKTTKSILKSGGQVIAKKGHEQTILKFQ